MTTIRTGQSSTVFQMSREILKSPVFWTFCVAFLVRGWWAMEWSQSPLAITPHLDAKSYYEWAQNIGAGEWMRGKVFYQAPLYPYFLSILLHVFGLDSFGVSWVQAAMDASTCALLAAITGRVLTPASRLAAGFLAALAPSMIFYTAPMMKETLGLFLLALFVYLLVRVWDPARFRASFLGSPFGNPNGPHDYGNKVTAFLAGFTLGALALVRSNALLTVATLPWVLTRRQWLSAAMGLAIPLVLTLAHNLSYGDAVLISSTGGFNLYIGHSPEAQGGGDYPHGIPTDPLEEEAVTQAIAESQTSHTLKPSEVSNYWSKRALSYALENPVAELRLFIQKFMRALNDWEAPDNYDQNFALERYSSFVGSLPGRFGVIFILSVLGLIFATRQHRWAATFPIWTTGALYFGSLLIFYVTDRYRLPLYVFLIPWAGYGLTETVLLLRHLKDTSFNSTKIFARSRAKFAAAAFLILGLAVIVTWPRPTQDASTLKVYNLGVVVAMFAQGGLNAEAISHFEEALKIDPFLISSEAYTRIGEVYERTGQLALAERAFKSGTNLHPQEGLPHHNLGRFYFDRGRFPEAREQFRQALKLTPWSAQAWTGLAAAEISLGHAAEARAALEEARRLQPDSPYLAQIEAAIQKAEATANE